MSYCDYCETRVETDVRGNFEYCADCGSNLGPTGATGVMF